MSALGYVVGFAFDPARRSVILIRKSRPERQRGLLNGVGGKVEPGEHPASAMRREFEEETGVATLADEWAEVAAMEGRPGDPKVHVFTCALDQGRFDGASSVTDEEVVTRTVSDLGLPRTETVGHVPWLVPLCCDVLDIRSRIVTPVRVRYVSIE